MFEKPTVKLSDIRQKVADLQKVIGIIEQYNDAVISFLVDEYGADQAAIDTQLVEDEVTAYIVGCQSRDDYVRSPSEFLENWLIRMSNCGRGKVGLSEKRENNEIA